jgi:DNA-binding response OmpR family regulator
MMPYKDGYTLAEIREKIMKFQLYFDSKINERRCAKGYKAGADDYLNKPLTLKFCL